MSKSPVFRNSFHLICVDRRPLLAFPHGSRSIHLASILCYPTHTWKKKLLKFAMWAAVWAGLSRWLWQTVSTPVPMLGVASIDSWLDELSENLRESCLQPVFVWPADAERGRVYVHLLDKAGVPIAFIKLALDQANNDLIRNEQCAIEKLVTMRLCKAYVPKLLGAGMVAKYSYLILEHTPRQAQIANWDKDIGIDEIIQEYAGQTRNISLAEVETSTWWQSFVGRDGSESMLNNIIEKIAVEGVDVCRIHGDFNKTNVLHVGKEVWLLDWERSCEGPHLTDRVCAEVDQLWPLAQRNISLAVNRFRSEHWDNRGPKYRSGVLLALAFLHAVEFTPATAFLMHWQISE